MALQAKGRQVCTCLNVSEPAITCALAQMGGSEEQRLQALQKSLKCGTNCGSCLPEVRRLVRSVAPLRQVA